MTNNNGRTYVTYKWLLTSLLAACILIASAGAGVAGQLYFSKAEGKALVEKVEHIEKAVAEVNDNVKFLVRREIDRNKDNDEDS